MNRTHRSPTDPLPPPGIEHGSRKLSATAPALAALAVWLSLGLGFAPANAWAQAKTAPSSDTKAATPAPAPNAELAPLPGSGKEGKEGKEDEAAMKLAQQRLENAASVAFLQGKRPAAPDAIATLGPDLFGDKVSLYNGALSIEQTDVQLPGTSALRVALDRQHMPGRQPIVRGAMGDWDLHTPRIEGAFAAVEGFVPSSGGAANRCTGFWRPPPVSRPSSSSRALQDFQPDEYWHGTNLVIPGHGSQEILTRENLPEAGEEWRLVTRGLWKLRCLDQLQNAPGQGFIARSPEGVTYRFDWIASRETTPLQKGGALLIRHDVFLMATRVEDRFGNWVEYRYDAHAPLNLVSITAGTQHQGSIGDPRKITLGYLNGRVRWVSDQVRTWTYEYDTQGALRHVVLPDASRWTFSLGSLVEIPGLIINDGNIRCDTLPLPIFAGGPLSGWMEHPSGARVEYQTEFVLHGRTNVPKFCTFLPGFRITNGSVFPHTTVSQTLVSKRITGPGMVPMLWEYFSGNVGAFATCESCPDRKVVTVKEPRGHFTRYTYGIRWRANDGQLLRVEHADADGNVLRSQNIRYRVPNGEFPDRFGNSVRFTTDLVSTLNRPEDRRETFQQGASFLWEVEGTGSSAFDQFARPITNKVKSDLNPAYEKLERRVWRDFSALWVT